MNAPALTQPARVWLRRSSLDRHIALGADPCGSPELARRAVQLNSPRFRAGLAAGLRRMVEAAEERRPVLSSQVPLNRRAILAERDLLQQLSEDLRSPEPLNVRGIALVERLLTNSRSPCYARGRDGELRLALRHARAALHLA